jgi:hypothetical protein
MSFPTLFEPQDIMFNEERCIEYLQSKEVFYNKHMCPFCEKLLIYYKCGYRYRCTTKNCPTTIPIRKNTFFDNTKLPIHKILFMRYLWLEGDTFTSIKVATGLSKQLRTL